MKAAILQMTSVQDPRVNLKFIKQYKEELQRKEIKSLFLPECFFSYTSGEKTPYPVRSGNEWEKTLKDLAIDLNVYLIGGSVVFQSNDSQEKFFNRSYVISPKGEFLSHYDKRHLFNCDLRNVFLSEDKNENENENKSKNKKKPYNESDLYTPGSKNQAVTIEGFRFGPSICFDLRFPEMFRAYSCLDQCDVLVIPAAFTPTTGKAHWHVLMRARAIENQCYVIAAAQCGQHNETVSTYGHSLVINPWGEILLDGGEEPGLWCFELAKTELVQVRARMRVRELGLVL